MNFKDISKKTIIAPELSAYKSKILKKMEIAYTGSQTAMDMFDKWIKDGKTIKIKFADDTVKKPASAKNSTGEIFLDIPSLDGFNYINYNGKSVPYTLLGAIVHELGHALAGKTDPKYDDISSITDYQGTNIPFVNKIWSEIKKLDAFKRSGEIGLDSMISYFGTSDKIFQRIGYDYTDKTPIDTAVNVDYLTRNKPAGETTGWNTAKLGVSKDLIIGGSRKNILESGAGDDFLFGGGGDDTLKGGAGKDTAIYFGNESDYDIVMHRDWLGIWDGSWDVSHARGEEVDGKDRLENIEYIRFGNGKKYEIKTAGLTFQSDLALVFDTTRSMGLYSNWLDYIKQQASTLTNAIFANNQDVRVGIVAYKDAANGEPSQVILPFTDHDNFADRQSAAIAAINSLTASGGGDNAETGFDGLRLALNGALGQWRPAAGNLRVVLFTDSPIKDYEIANEVSNFAHNIGATVGTSSTETLPGGYIDTYSLALINSYGGVENYTPCEISDDYCCHNFCTLTGETTNIPFVPSTEPIEIVPMTAQVQIFTIFTGPEVTNTKALEAIANANGGTFQAATTNEDIFQKLLAIVSASPVEPTPTTVSVIATDFEAAEAKSGEIADPGQFMLARTGNLSQPLTVAYNLSGTATNGSDYQNLTGAAIFAADKDSATIDLNIIDDNISERIETVTLTLTESSNYTIDSNNSDPIAIFDNDFSPTRLIQPTSNSLSIEGGEGQSLLKFTKLGNAGNSKDEIAAFVVDDELGSIDGILPGDDRYLAAAIGRSQTIFSSLGNSTLDLQFDRNSERYLSFSSGDRLQFLLVADDTLDSIRDNLNNGKQTSNVFFSLPAANLNQSEQAIFNILANNDGYQIARSDNFVIQVQTSDRYTLTSGSGLQGGWLGEVLDLRDFLGQDLKVDLDTVSDAAYNNYIGFYAVEDDLGSLANGLKPRDIGYAEAALRSAVLQSSKNESRSDLAVSGGKIFAPVVIANGTFQDFMDLNPQNQANSNVHAYFNYLGANPDKVDHFRLLGDNKFGVEDLYGGGDRDYNDLIVGLALRN